MIDREQAEQIAAVWARRDSLRLGHECRPLVTEFDLGYVITSTLSTQVRTLPGDLPTTVVDKETGEVSTWPRVPPDVVEQLYRRSRRTGPRVPRTVDPASQLLREIRRAATPTTAAHLTIEGRIFTAHGAKGDVELNHHPLVRAYLDGLSPGHLVRGGDRHAELIVVSDVLYEYDQRRAAEGIAPMSTGDAAGLLQRCTPRVPLRSRAGRSRRWAAPNAPATPASTSSSTSTCCRGPNGPGRHRGIPNRLLPRSRTVFRPTSRTSLVAAGWRPHFGDEVVAMSAIRDVSAVHSRATRTLGLPRRGVHPHCFPEPGRSPTRPG